MSIKAISLRKKLHPTGKQGSQQRLSAIVPAKAEVWVNPSSPFDFAGQEDFFEIS